jgi:penicillin-binding protein 1A
MMSDVVRRGTAARATALKRGDLAGKTGTTNDLRDAWFCGYNSTLVGTAWVGFDKERPLGRGEQGSRTALPMWIYFMREALAGVPQRRLPMPDGVVTARISSGVSEFGEEAPAEFEYFLADHLPAGVSGAETAEGEPPPQKYEEPIF